MKTLFLRLYIPAILSLTTLLCACGGGGSTCPAYSQEYKFETENGVNITQNTTTFTNKESDI